MTQRPCFAWFEASWGNACSACALQTWFPSRKQRALRRRSNAPLARKPTWGGQYSWRQSKAKTFGGGCERPTTVLSRATITISASMALASRCTIATFASPPPICSCEWSQDKSAPPCSATNRGPFISTSTAVLVPVPCDKVQKRRSRLGAPPLTPKRTRSSFTHTGRPVKLSPAIRVTQPWLVVRSSVFPRSKVSFVCTTKNVPLGLKTAPSDKPSTPLSTTCGNSPCTIMTRSFPESPEPFSRRPRVCTQDMMS
mmetsp:Transcript_55488/g.66848  ORF Transcript_55488/g.66848 Transcript_55488/m.66848 type:complete len:255 (-) Transcript_55488:332-1096(-)